MAHKLVTLKLGEEASIHQISLLELEGSTSDREQRSLDAHTRDGSLVETADSLSLPDLDEHLAVSDLRLESLLSLHTSLQHIHRSHQTRGNASSDHTSDQQTVQGNVSVLVSVVVLDSGVEGEEDHGVGDITQKSDGRTLVHSTQTEILAHYVLETM